MSGAPRARLPGDPPRRAERPLPGRGDAQSRPLSGDPCIAPANPEAIREAAHLAAACASGLCCWSAAAQTGPAPADAGRAPLRPGRDPRRSRPMAGTTRCRIRTRSTSAPWARRLAGGRRRVPPGGSAARRRLAPRPTPPPISTIAISAGDPHRADRHPRRRYRAVLPRRGRPSRPTRARPASRCLTRRPRARGRPRGRRTAWRTEAEALRAQRQARLEPATADSTRFP